LSIEIRTTGGYIVFTAVLWVTLMVTVHIIH